MGSKNKISKYIVPIIQELINNNGYDNYIEPFVGGANLIDKIECNNKYGYDINENLIELLQYAQLNDLPETITENEYNKVKNNKENYPKWYVGLVGFCGSFGAKYFGGYARRNNGDDVPAQAIRNLRKQSQSKNFKDIIFDTADFRILQNIKNSLIYCDIPYKGTTQYKNNNFPYDEFYDWCIKMSKNNTVLISEYDMPSDKFTPIWSMELKTSLGSGVNVNSDRNRIEKLFMVNGDL